MTDDEDGAGSGAGELLLQPRELSCRVLQPRHQLVRLVPAGSSDQHTAKLSNHLPKVCVQSQECEVGGEAGGGGGVEAAPGAKLLQQARHRNQGGAPDISNLLRAMAVLLI